jgi:hypothetical protein
LIKIDLTDYKRLILLFQKNTRCPRTKNASNAKSRSKAAPTKNSVAWPAKTITTPPSGATRYLNNERKTYYVVYDYAWMTFSDQKILIIRKSKP